MIGRDPVALGAFLPSDVVYLLTPVPAASSGTAVRSQQELSDGYRRSVRDYVLNQAPLVAQLVGRLGDALLRIHGRDLVLVSVIRAGTPIGVLVKRWLRFRHGLTIPHLSLSISSEGIDPVAVGWLLHTYPCRPIQLIDGWTSKGTVSGHLTACRKALGYCGIDSRLAVLVDAGGCAGIHAFRGDLLLPHACLGDHMSGGLGRSNPTGKNLFDTVETRSLEGDLSNEFVDSVAARFVVIEDDDQDSDAYSARLPSGYGAAEALRLARCYNVTQPELVNIGASEASRGVLRRQHGRLFVRADPSDRPLTNISPLLDLAHLHHIPVQIDADLLVSAALV